MSLGLYCNVYSVAAESSGMVARLQTSCSGRHWSAKTAVVELIVRCVQVCFNYERPWIWSHETWTGPDGREPCGDGVEVGKWRSVLGCWSSGKTLWRLFHVLCPLSYENAEYFTH